MYNQKPSCCQESNKQEKKLADFILWSNFYHKKNLDVLGIKGQFIQAFVP